MFGIQRRIYKNFLLKIKIIPGPGKMNSLLKRGNKAMSPDCKEESAQTGFSDFLSRCHKGCLSLLSSWKVMVLIIITLFTLPSNKAQGSGYSVTYTYDSTFPNGLGRLASVIDPSGTSVFYHDKMGRVARTDKTVVATSTTYTTQSSYDTGGRILNVTYPDNTTVNYHYNGPIPDQVYNSTTSFIQYSTYNSMGQPANATYGNGVVAQYTYSNSNSACTAQNFRLCTALVKQPASLGSIPIENAQYGYDPGGNITSISDTVPSNGNQTFGYDYQNGQNRLTSATGPYGSATYAYDQLGDMTCNGELSSCNSSSPNYQYKDSKHLHAVTYGSGTTYVYDSNGNMIVRGGNTLGYDGEDRLISVTTSTANSTVNMIYDGDGGRVQKIVNGAASYTTTYIGNLYECTTITSTTCIKYILLGGQRIAVQTVGGTSIYYYHGNQLGSIFAMTDSYGRTTETISYLPYGRSVSDIGSMSVEQKYTSQQFDTETALYFYGARYYDPSLGRFVSADTIVGRAWDPQSFNRYSYVRNNPINYADPSGHTDLFGYCIDCISTYTGGIGHFGKEFINQVNDQANGMANSWSIGSESGQAIAAGVIIIATAVATAECGGCGAWQEAALFSATVGEVAGGYGASQGHGNFLNGVVVGGIIGGISGAATGELSTFYTNLGNAVPFGGWGGSVAQASANIVDYIVNNIGLYAEKAGLGAVMGAISGGGIGGVTSYQGGKGDFNSVMQGAELGAEIGAITGVAFGALDASGYLNKKTIGFDWQHPFGKLVDCGFSCSSDLQQMLFSSYPTGYVTATYGVSAAAGIYGYQNRDTYIPQLLTSGIFFEPSFPCGAACGN